MLIILNLPVKKFAKAKAFDYIDFVNNHSKRQCLRINGDMQDDVAA